MKYCTNCVSPSSAPLPGKTSSNGCYYALRQNKNIISASNSSPSHSLTLESFAQVKTCNQFNMIEAALQGLERVGVEIRLYDDTAPAEERLLHAHRLGAQHARVNDAQTKASAGRGPQSSSRFDMAGRQWTLTVSPTPEDLASHRTWQEWTSLTC